MCGTSWRRALAMELEDRRGFPRPIVCPSYPGSLRLRDRKERAREREREGDRWR